jgi:hydroxymethylglutaryl-CoA reductase
MMFMSTASAPHKIILIGEHAVVHGKVGIAGAIDSRVFVKAQPGQRGIRVLDPLGLNNFKNSREELSKILSEFRTLYEKKDLEALRKFNFSDCIRIVVAETLDRIGWADVEIEMHRRDTLKGIGGSAALWAATAAAMGEAFGKRLTKEQINEIAYLGDVVAHGGTPSGIDNSTVVYGGYLKFTKAGGPKPLKIDFEVPIVIIDSGEPANTGMTVPYVRRQLEAEPERVQKILDRLHDISNDALNALVAHDLKKVGKFMTDYYQELRKLDISTEKLDRIINIAMDNGALGAKPTGGWGGGVCIALVEDAENADELIKTFQKNNFRAFTTKLGAEGVRLEE